MASTADSKDEPGLESADRALDIDMVTVSHKHHRFLEAFMTSLYGTPTRVSFKLTLIDNVPDPATRELVQTRFPQVRLIENDRPKGFATNNNRVVVGSRARYVFLLNPDTEVQPDALDTLVAFMDAHPEVGACGPKLVYPDGRLQLSCREFPTLGSFLVRRTPLRRLMKSSRVMKRYEMADWDHRSSRAVGWLFGAAILARREMAEQVGGLDENMFLYSEDVDWCLRCRRAGWEIYYVPDAVITHHLDDAKYNRYFSRHRLLHYKTMFQFVCKHWRYCLKW